MLNAPCIALNLDDVYLLALPAPAPHEHAVLVARHRNVEFFQHHRHTAFLVSESAVNKQLTDVHAYQWGLNS